MYTYNQELGAYVAGERAKKARNYKNNFPQNDLLRDHYDAGFDRKVFHPQAERT